MSTIKRRIQNETHAMADSPYVSSGTSSDEEEPSTRRRATHRKLETGAERIEGGVVSALYSTACFYVAAAFFLCGGKYGMCPVFGSQPHAKAQVYSLVTTLWMWNQPHYRTGSFQDDMKTNLRNVAIPGTGIPLSLLVSSKLLAFAFLLIGYPMVCAVAGLRKGGFSVKDATQAYAEQLLCPQDWFSFWRLNCVVASYQGVVNNAQGFKQEDKWTFLTDAKEAGVPVTPWLDAEAIVVKDKNEEGGMGIHFFKNAVHGGQWIIQPKLNNAGIVKQLLPAKAPLSTLRVITASRGGMRTDCAGPQGPLAGEPQPDDVVALSCVFRAGRARSLTDHDSVLFDVDINTGTILKGTTNQHWYQLGADKVLTTPWICRNHTITEHPDVPGKKVTGHVIPDIEGIRKLCEDAHYRLLPDVPLAGWDVALTEEAGMCLLETNLSCNFFRGTFDQKEYFRFVSEYFEFLDTASRK